MEVAKEIILQAPIRLGSLIAIIGWLSGSILYLIGSIVTYYNNQKQRRDEQQDQRISDVEAKLDKYKDDHAGEHKTIEESCRDRHEYTGIERRKC